ncbi:MAG: DUF488 domain-containing protein [candidate division NC10 bacterium]|nr:DUF488 domain-containing protein [candidate division NC10 bacterium]
METTVRQLYTIGHSTRSLEDFLHLLRMSHIACLTDVRTIPRSRHAPQFNRDVLQAALPNAGLRYVHLPRLGGLRQSRAGESPNGGWRSAGFQGFADHMQTEEFARGLDELWGLAGQCRTAIMCAEALYRRCHRALIGDAFMVRGGTVSHILAEQKIEDHRMTPFAVVLEGRITYPPRH